MKIFLNYFNFYNCILIGNQNVISDSESLLFNNSGFSAIKKLIFFNKNNFVNYQYCIRLKGIFNDLKNNNDGIHKTSFIMLGVFYINKKKFKMLKLAINYLIYFKKIKKKKIFFTVNVIDYESVIFLLLLKINIKKIIFTKKNIWKINKNGFLGKCVEIYIKKKNKLIEIWNIVDINFLKINNFVYKLKINIIDTGLGYNRIKIINNINLKLEDICNTIYLIKNNVNLIFTKNHNFILNKLFKIIIKIVVKKKINIYKIFLFFLKKKIFFYLNNKYEFIKFIIKKEYIFFFDTKKIINFNINIENFKLIYKTYGIYYEYIYDIIKKIYQ